jgi:ketopantoate reductase
MQKNICVLGVGGLGGYFGETIIRLGKELQVPTPVTEKIFESIVRG